MAKIIEFPIVAKPINQTDPDEFTDEDWKFIEEKEAEIMAARGYYKKVTD